MNKEILTASLNGKQSKSSNIFENDDWIIPNNIWNNITSKAKSIEEIYDNGKIYKYACSNKTLCQKQYFFSIVIYVLKNNLDWNFIDRIRNEAQHNIYKKINNIIKEKATVCLEKEEIIKYKKIKDLFSRSYPSTSQINKFFSELVDRNVFNEIFYGHLAYEEPFLGLDWYCAESGPPPIWKIRYKSRKRKNRGEE